MKNKLTRVVQRIALVGAWVTAVLAIVGPVFQATLYWKIPVEPGEPAGFGDLLLLLHFFAIATSFWVTLGVSALLMIGSWTEHRAVAAKYIGVALVSALAYYMLSMSLPKLM